jgi:hypothetical protein
MGRPLNKRFFGPLDDGTNITISCQVGSANESKEGYILRQRTSRKFLVNDTKDGTKTTPTGTGTGNVGICTLVDKVDGSLADNEMAIYGYVAGTTGTQVRIKKFYNRTCRDFSNVRYRWEVSNDSTASIITLTAI